MAEWKHKKFSLINWLYNSCFSYPGELIDHRGFVLPGCLQYLNTFAV